MSKRIILSMAMLACTVGIYGQTRSVSGTVTDESGTVLAGATVRVKGGQSGTHTDSEGRFVLKGVAETDRLVISYIGMKSQTLEPQATMKVVLVTDDQNLDEAIVVAFGEQKKSSFTGSAGVINSKALEQRQLTNVMEALQGNVAGLQAYSHSGAPDANPEFRIRGISSINAGNNPLIILDGAPYDGEWNSINPSDVESVTVLKDAASNALYGARGANGVIIVTTHKGSKGHTAVTLDMKFSGSSRASKRYATIDNPAQYLETYYTALKNYNLSKGMTEYAAHTTAVGTLTRPSAEGGLGYVPYCVPQGQYLIGDNGRLNPNATLGNRVYNNGNVYTLMPDDWIDAAYRNAFRHEYNVGVSGGNDKSQFYASLGYLNAEGIAVASDYERITGRLKASYDATRWLTLGGNVSFARATSNNGADRYDTEDDGGTNIFTQIVQIAPIYPVWLRDGEGLILRDANGPVGDYGDGQMLGSGYVRPYLPQTNGIADASLNANHVVSTTVSLNGNADFNIYEGLTATLGANVYVSKYNTTFTYNPYYGFGHATYPGGYVYRDSFDEYTYNLQQLLRYSRQFGRHNLNLLAGHEGYRYEGNDLYGDRKNMYSYFGNRELNGATTLIGNGSYAIGYNTEGWIFRALYDWDGRYFAQVSYRRDASSRFHPDHRWGNFYSFGGAWMMTREPFMQDLERLQTLKLKFSFGQNGNDNISDFLYTDTYSISKGEGNDIGLVLSHVGNERITWETVTNINAGVEFEAFGHRLRGGAEYFYRKTTDMLCTVKVPLSMGFAGYASNVGDMANQGLEIELEGDPLVTPHAKLTLGGNLTAYRNRVLTLNEDNKYNVLEGHAGYTSGNYFYGEGLPMYTWRLIKYAGVSENGESMWYMHADDGSLTTTTNPNDISRDIDYFDCGTALPSFYGGFQGTLTLWGVDLSATFTYSVGGKVMDWTYKNLMSMPVAGSTGSAMHEDVLKAWSTTNTESAIPRLQYDDKYTGTTSDRFLTSGTWVGLQSISLGYSLPQQWTRRMGMQQLRITLNGENLTYWSKRKGLDPRVNDYGAVTATKYAPSRTVTGGLSLQF